MNYKVDNLSSWFMKMVESGEFKNPIPYPLFRASVSKWCKSDDQFDKLAQAVIAELLKHDIHVTPDKFAQEKKQQIHQTPKDNTLLLDCSDPNNTSQLLAWLCYIVNKAKRDPSPEKILFTADFQGSISKEGNLW